MYMDTLDMSSLTSLGLAAGLGNELSFRSSDEYDIFSPPAIHEIFTELAGIEEVKEEKGIKEDKEMTELSTLLPDIMEEVGISSPESISSELDLEQNQILIDEVENYLQGVQEEVGSYLHGVQEEVESYLQGVQESTSAMAETVDESWSQHNLEAETDMIFSALSSGNVMMEDVDLKQEDLKNAFTTSVTGEHGENVIIILAPPSPVAPPSPQETSYLSSALSPSSSATYESDIDWSPCPAPTTLSPTRRKYQRKVRPTPPSAPYPKEKGERKKAQNRSAAYKYREKKKAEQDLIDNELSNLANRNSVLKKRLSDMEVEMKCLKKLMKETGLLS
jgi:hypothetical protein